MERSLLEDFGVVSGTWGTQLKSSKGSLGAGVLLAGAWTMDVQTSATAPG